MVTKLKELEALISAAMWAKETHPQISMAIRKQHNDSLRAMLKIINRDVVDMTAGKHVCCTCKAGAEKQVKPKHECGMCKNFKPLQDQPHKGVCYVHNTIVDESEEGCKKHFDSRDGAE